MTASAFAGARGLGINDLAGMGRAALDNPDLPASFIAESLMSMAEPREDSTVFVPRSAAKA